MLAKHRAIGDIHQQTECEAPAHADLTELSNAPETQDQCNPVRHAWPVCRWQEVEERGGDQAEEYEPGPDRQQNAG